MSDVEYMQLAIQQAVYAAEIDEVPIGAVMVRDGLVIAAAHNLRETEKDPLAHAEIRVIHDTAQALGGWRLPGCTLYVTLEPCPMCAGAIINARIPRVVFGAFDPKAGALGSIYNLAEGKLNHTPEVTGGVLGEECASLLKNYFRNKRKGGSSHGM